MRPANRYFTRPFNDAKRENYWASEVECVDDVAARMLCEQLIIVFYHLFYCALETDRQLYSDNTVKNES